MRKITIFTIAMLCAALASAQEPRISRFDVDSLHLEGAYCGFDQKGGGTVLASDWGKKFWMKIDGKMVEFAGTRSNSDIATQLAGKHWQETLTAKGITVILDLAETGRASDTAAFQGYIDVKRNMSVKRIAVDGGCGA